MELTRCRADSPSQMSAYETSHSTPSRQHCSAPAASSSSRRTVRWNYPTSQDHFSFMRFQEQQNQSLAFYLTPEQANIVSNGRVVQSNGMVVYKMHILLRFTKISDDGIQDDDFPKNLILKINNKVNNTVILEMEPSVLSLSSPCLHELPNHLISEVVVRNSHLEIVCSQPLHLPPQAWRTAGRLGLCWDVNPQSSLVVLSPRSLRSTLISFY